MDDLASLALGAAILLGLPLCLAWLLRRQVRGGFTPAATFVALHFFVFHALSSLTYGFGARGWVGLLFLALSSLVLTATFGRMSLARSAGEGDSAGPVLISLGMSLVAIATDWWVFRSQGFNFETGLSRFAAPFAGDHWRHSAIISGLIREDQSIFFPDSQLAYQVLWHHGAAAIISALPDASTTFKRELALTLVTGLLMYFCLFNTILTIRPKIGGSWPLIGLILALAGTEADIFNAGLSYLQFGHVAFAADSSSSIPSPYRYFSLKLVSLTAPQHAVFFMFAALAIRELQRVVNPSTQDPTRVWDALRSSLAHACMGALFSPVLAVLVLPFIYFIVITRTHALRIELFRVARYCAVAMIAVLTLHWVILRMAVWTPFLRPNITGGGSGAYGVKFFPVIDLSNGLAANLPWALVATSGVLGFVVSGLIVWMILARRALLLEPLVLSFLVSCLFWNLVVVDTEIQRHFSMAIAFLGLLILALYIPWRSRLAGMALVVIPVIGACALLNGYFIRAYERNAGFMPLTTAWQDYFCMNDIVRSRFPGMPLVLATPRHFELPIGVEAGPALVWSQVAAVHQKMSAVQAREMDAINPRDWATFRKIGEADSGALLQRLQVLGYKGVVWGPVEEEMYGPGLAAAFARPGRFLASCGFVGLYSFYDGDLRAPVDPESAHSEFRARLSTQPERLLSRAEGVALKIVSASDSKNVSVGRNIAKGAKASVSGREPRGAAELVVDGLKDERRSPALLTGNQFLPWWQVDLGATYTVNSVRIVTPREKSYPQYELKNAYIILSDHPFQFHSPLSEARKIGTVVRFFSGEIAGEVVIPVGASGRYLRIQASDQRHLMLTEVEVYSSSADNHREQQE